MSAGPSPELSRRLVGAIQQALREEKGIYMADSGRFNVVGLSDDNVDRFAAAVVEKMDG